MLCLNGSCIEGCIENSDCPLSTYCYENQCTPGCNGDDDLRCAESETCEDNVCRFTCGSDDDCGDEKICINTECVVGCRNDDDCGGWTPNCDTSVTPGVCRAGCWGDACWGDQVCNDDDFCVDCVENWCDNGYSCVDYYCWIDEPLELCEECRDSRDCGEVTSLKLRRRLVGRGEKFLCASVRFAQRRLPQRVRVPPKESVDGAIAAQCVPYTAGGEYEEESNEIEPYGEISCQAHRDYLEHKGCGRRSGGGGGPGGWVGCADGAICSGWGITSTLGDTPTCKTATRAPFSAPKTTIVPAKTASVKELPKRVMSLGRLVAPPFKTDAAFHAGVFPSLPF